MAKMALRFILGDSTVCTVIPGMRKLKHVVSDLATSDKGSLDKELMFNLTKHRWDGKPTDWSQ
ncbi:hypothetical protein L0P88_13080 [Muricauda sp. SCSIO 64092]|uniref:hypothetical protein n=1 Tax=Allomuricauda sp. SCSIO 64092 TaxID=2908842 RepID=UPI001FF46798|nr:hypothetical protein [Muricauda sp. SCSIO 64092]UOY04886.1 hypothetical protein L0P88_13080 [Muricauda sp. SCSIO 64092]